MKLFRDESSNPKWNAQRNLCGRTHYVDDEGEFATDQITGLKADCYRVKLWVNQSSL